MSVDYIASTNRFSLVSKKKSLKVVTKKTILFEEAGLFGLLHLSVYKARTIMRSFEQGLDVPPFNKTKSQTKI